MKDLFKKHFKPLPLISYPAVNLLNVSVTELTHSSSLQAKGIKKLQEKYHPLASVSYMDLSLEAEAFGSVIEFSDKIPTVKGCLIKSLDEIENLKIPAISERMKISLNALKEAKQDNVLLYGGMIGPFTLAARLMDLNEIIFGCYDSKEQIHKLLTIVSDFLKIYLTKIKETKVDGVIIACPMSGLLTNELCEEFSSYYLNKVIEEIKDDSFKVIYHNCGNVLALYEAIILVNADAFHFGNSVDLEKVLERDNNKHVILGNLDPLLFLSDIPSKVYFETIKLLSKCSKYENFIPSTGCDVPHEANFSCIDAFYLAVERFYNYRSDVDLLIDVLNGTKTSKEVLLMELIIDDDILKQITTKYLNREWIDYQRNDQNARMKYFDNIVLCYKMLGYSGLRVSNGLMFNLDFNKTSDRFWANHDGKIKDLESFNNYPWPTMDDLDLFDYLYVSSILPEGMGIFACCYGGIFEMLCEYLVGFEALCFMEYDDPQLLQMIFERVSNLLLSAYQEIAKIDKVKAIFQGDDFGFTQGLLFPKEFYQKYVFPWHKKLSQIALENNIPYYLHSCGNLRLIKDDLLELGISAKHSFEDKGWSVVDFYQEFSSKMGVIGGVDVDKLTRYNLKELESYCLDILDKTHKNGRYAFGSGNSIASYIPLENYLFMLYISYIYGR